MSETVKQVKRRSNRGFTLIEALVSTVLLGVGVVGLMSAATLGLRNSQRAGQRSMAMYLAMEKLAEVEVMGPHIWMLGHPMEGSEPRGSAEYLWTIAIDQLAVGELFDVRVKVQWSSAAGDGSVELETWLNDYEAMVSEERQLDASGK
jgi:prepilin-type N-terminal cleavage/methylation domain-containing protein